MNFIVGIVGGCCVGISFVCGLAAIFIAPMNLQIPFLVSSLVWVLVGIYGAHKFLMDELSEHKE